MDKLQAMEVFVQVVDAGGFTRAAEIMQLPKATVSTLISGLESSLSVKLLNRTTRQVSLTADGAAYYERTARLLTELEEIDASLSNAQASPKGRIRVDVPASVARQIIIPALHTFHARYPDIQIDLGVGDRLVNLIADNVDCVVRGGNLQDESLVARRIAQIEFVTCATTSYLEAYGVPTHPSELDGPHHVVGYFSAGTGRLSPFEFNRGGEHIELPGRYVVAVNDSNAYLAAGLQGLGIIQTPAFMIDEHLASGEMVPVLEDWTSPSMPVYVVYPPNRHLSAKIRVFVDWVAELFAPYNAPPQR